MTHVGSSPNPNHPQLAGVGLSLAPSLTSQFPSVETQFLGLGARSGFCVHLPVHRVRVSAGTRVH